MRRVGLLLLALVAVAASWVSGPGAAQAGVAALPTITMSEDYDTNSQIGTYTVTIDSPGSDPWQIVAFAVENNDSQSAFTDRSGWSGIVLTEADWNTGFTATFSTPGDSFDLFSTDDIGAFDALFGTDATQVNFYWWSLYYGFGIGPDETSSEAHWSEALPASTFSAFLSLDAPGSGNVGISTVSGEVATVAEPATAASLGLALLGLGYMRRRRRTA